MLNGTVNKIEESITFRASNNAQITFEANRISELNLFENIYKEPRTGLERAEATVQIALGYQPDRLKVFTVFTLYDSLCRTCDELKNSLKVTVARQVSGIIYKMQKKIVLD